MNTILTYMHPNMLSCVGWKEVKLWLVSMPDTTFTAAEVSNLSWYEPTGKLIECSYLKKKKEEEEEGSHPSSIQVNLNLEKLLHLASCIRKSEKKGTSSTTPWEWRQPNPECGTFYGTTDPYSSSSRKNEEYGGGRRGQRSCSVQSHENQIQRKRSLNTIQTK